MTLDKKPLGTYLNPHCGPILMICMAIVVALAFVGFLVLQGRNRQTVPPPAHPAAASTVSQ